MRKALLLVLAIALCGMAQAFEFNRMPAGMINGAGLVYSSSTTIKLGVGYGEVMGSYWEIGATDSLVTAGYTLTGLSASTDGVLQYIYVDRVNSSFPSVTLKNSTTAPTWSNDFMGWYNSADRCIGVVRILPNGSIAAFYCPEDDSYIWESDGVNLTQTLPSNYGVWSTLGIGTYVPANARAALVAVDTYTTTAAWAACRVGVSDEYATQFIADGVTRARVDAYIPFKRGGSKNIKWMAYGHLSNNSISTSGNLAVRIGGYKISR